METVQYLKKHPMAALEVVTLLVIALCGLYVSIADLFFTAQGEENRFIILGQSKESASVAVLLVSLLITALAVERLTHFNVIETRLDQLMRQKVSVNIVRGGEEIFRGGVRALQESRWKVVRIFAPVGLWAPLAEKQEWLSELADCLDKDRKSGKERVESFYGIFGFPPPLTTEVEKTKEKLRYVRKNLRRFEGKRNAHIRYIPPVEVSVGLGAILLENVEYGIKQAHLAFACRQDHWVVDTGLSLENLDQMFSCLIDWFDRSLFECSTDRFRFQDRDHKMSVQWQEVMGHYEKEFRIPWEEENEERAVKLVK